MRTSTPVNDSCPRPPRVGAPPAAFTLFEVLLVIGILSIIMALAWPSFDRMLDARQLTDSADQLRSLLRSARRDAMADGLNYRCDYRMEDSMLRLVPASDPFHDEDAPADQSSADESFEPTRERFEFPDRIRILDQRDFDEGPPDLNEALPADSQDSSAASEQEPTGEEGQPGGDWIPLAEFRPDGSATEVTLHLVDPDRRTIEVRVRAMTGEVVIGDVDDWLTEDEKREREEEEQRQHEEESFP